VRYPNLRYGNPNELRHYAQFIQIKDLAKRLRRDERTVRNWLTEREKLPWWVPEIIRLQKMEHDEMLRQMNMKPQPLMLGLVTRSATVYQFPMADPAKPEPHQDTYTLPLFAQA
jgi:hypothetical protein